MRRLVALLALLMPVHAWAQAVPNMARPVTLAGPTGLNAAMASKADAANGSLTNATINASALNASTLTGAKIDTTSTVGGVAITNPSWLGFQRGNVTLNVCPSGCTYSTVHDAFYAALNLAHWALDSTTTFTVQVADGSYNEPWQMVSQDPLGYRVRVLGDTLDRTRVVLNFTNVVGNNLGGFIANNGGQIGYIDGFTMNAVGTISSQTAAAIHWTPNSEGAGIGAIGNGVIQVGPHMAINGFYYGLVADHGGSMIADGATVTNAGDVGIFAKFGGVMRCQGCSSSFTADTDRALGSNYMAEQGGHLDIDSAKGDQALYSGVAGISGGSVWANNFQGGSSGAGGLGGRGAWGVWTVNGGSVQIEGATVQNYYVGVNAQAGGSVDINGTTIQNNNSNGVSADGGAVRGVFTTIKNNNGFGVQATHMGTVELYQTFANMSNNTQGNVAQNAAGTENGASYGVASIVLE